MISTFGAIATVVLATAAVIAAQVWRGCSRRAELTRQQYESIKLRVVRVGNFLVLDGQIMGTLTKHYDAATDVTSWTARVLGDKSSFTDELKAVEFITDNIAYSQTYFYV